MQVLPVQIAMEQKEAVDVLSVPVWVQAIVFYVLMIRCRRRLKAHAK